MKKILALLFGTCACGWSTTARADADFSALEAKVPQRDVVTNPLHVKRQLQEFGVSVSRIESSLTSHREKSARGVDVVLSLGLAPRLPVLRVSGYRAFIFRALDDKTFSFSPFQGLEGGAHLGFLEAGASVGASALAVDVAHGRWSIGFLEPRVTGFAGFKFHELRLRAVAFSEFYWRWFGEDSAFIHGLGLQLVVGAVNAS